MLEFDVETTGLQSYAGDRMFLAQFLGRYDAEWTLPEATGDDLWLPESFGLRPAGGVRTTQALLDSAVSLGGIRAWNAKFDLGFAHRAGFKLPPEHLWHDGMLMAHIMDSSSSVALKARGERLFGADERDLEAAVAQWLAEERKRRRKISKSFGVPYVAPTYEDVPADIMVPYGLQDVVLQRKVCEVYERALATNDKLRDVYEMERGVLAASFWMEQRGIPIDREAAVRFEASVLGGLEGRDSQLKELAGIDTFNPNSGIQLAEALERRGVDLSRVPLTPTGRKQMSEEVLENLDDDLAAAVLEWKRDTKILNTYLTPILHGRHDDKWGQQHPYLGPDDRIHPNIRQVGAITGRQSVGEPNMQNWHRDDLRMRYLVAAGEGKKLVTADLDAIEMKLFAAFAGQGTLLDQVNDPQGDPHAYTAEMVGITDKKRGRDVTTARQMAKVFNFSMIYGGGVRTVQKTFGVSASRAKEMIHRYHEAYPEIGTLQDNVRYKLEQQGYVETPYGRRHRANPNIPIMKQAYKFPNHLVQGTAAELLKEALIKIHKDGIPVILTIHDEVLAEVDESDAEEAAHLIHKHMTGTERLVDANGDKVVNVEAEALIVDRWSDAKTPGYVPDYMRGA